MIIGRPKVKQPGTTSLDGRLQCMFFPFPPRREAAMHVLSFLPLYLWKSGWPHIAYSSLCPDKRFLTVQPDAIGKTGWPLSSCSAGRNRQEWVAPFILSGTSSSGLEVHAYWLTAPRPLLRGATEVEDEQGVSATWTLCPPFGSQGWNACREGQIGPLTLWHQLHLVQAVLHGQWTGVRFGLVQILAISSAANTALGTAIPCHKIMGYNN